MPLESDVSSKPQRSHREYIWAMHTKLLDRSFLFRKTLSTRFDHKTGCYNIKTFPDAPLRVRGLNLATVFFPVYLTRFELCGDNANHFNFNMTLFGDGNYKTLRSSSLSMDLRVVPFRAVAAVELSFTPKILFLNHRERKRVANITT